MGVLLPEGSALAFFLQLGIAVVAMGGGAVVLRRRLKPLMPYLYGGPHYALPSTRASAPGSDDVGYARLSPAAADEGIDLPAMGDGGREEEGGVSGHGEGSTNNNEEGVREARVV